MSEVSKVRISFAKLTIAAILVIMVGAVLWFAVPTTDTAIAANNQGADYNKKGEYYKAIESFNKAIELDSVLAVA